MNHLQLEAAYDKALKGWEHNLRKVSQLEVALDTLKAENEKLTARVAELGQGYVETAPWVVAAQDVVSMFDPLKPKADPVVLLLTAKAAKKANADLRAERDSLRTSAAKDQAELASLKSQLAEAGATVVRKAAEADDLFAELASMRAEVTSLKARAEEMKSEASATAHGLWCSEQRYAAARVEVAQLRGDITIVRRHCDETRTERDAARAEVEQLTRDAADLAAEVESLKADNERLAKADVPRWRENADLREQLRVAREALEPALVSPQWGPDDFRYAVKRALAALSASAPKAETVVVAASTPTQTIRRSPCADGHTPECEHVATSKAHVNHGKCVLYGDPECRDGFVEEPTKAEPEDLMTDEFTAHCLKQKEPDPQRALLMRVAEATRAGIARYADEESEHARRLVESFDDARLAAIVDGVTKP